MQSIVLSSHIDKSQRGLRENGTHIPPTPITRTTNFTGSSLLDDPELLLLLEGSNDSASVNPAASSHKKNKQKQKQKPEQKQEQEQEQRQEQRQEQENENTTEVDAEFLLNLDITQLLAGSHRDSSPAPRSPLRQVEIKHKILEANNSKDSIVDKPAEEMENQDCVVPALKPQVIETESYANDSKSIKVDSRTQAADNRQTVSNAEFAELDAELLAACIELQRSAYKYTETHRPGSGPGLEQLQVLVAELPHEPTLIACQSEPKQMEPQTTSVGVTAGDQGSVETVAKAEASEKHKGVNAIVQTSPMPKADLRSHEADKLYRTIQELFAGFTQRLNDLSASIHDVRTAVDGLVASPDSPSMHTCIGREATMFGVPNVKVLDEHTTSLAPIQETSEKDVNTETGCFLTGTNKKVSIQEDSIKRASALFNEADTATAAESWYYMQPQC